MNKFYFFIALLTFTACNEVKRNDFDWNNQAVTIDIPSHFPDISHPEGNEPTALKIKLGKKLFFDKRLSKDTSIACASCHFQQHAFSDNKSLSEGFQKRNGFRNAPPLFNLAYHPYFFLDGGVPTIELQILAPIEDTNEMNFSVLEVIQRLENDKEIQKLAQLAYQRKFDPFVLTRSIAAFERTLVSGNSRYDKYIQGDSLALSPDEKQGMNLFFDKKTNCSKCHSGFNFTDYSFRNIGLYEHYADSGRARISLNPLDRGKFKTPSLRNIALTAPYMHDGSFSTLEKVIAHFVEGGKNHANKDELIRPLSLLAEEQTQLLRFLHTLTDSNFIYKQNFMP